MTLILSVTGSRWTPMLIHALLDLRVLLLVTAAPNGSPAAV